MGYMIMEKLIKKQKRYKKKAQKYRALYIKWLAKERGAAKALRTAYYRDEDTRNVALETLHQYGLSKETMEEED